jgi:hypothetical protein
VGITEAEMDDLRERGLHAVELLRPLADAYEKLDYEVRQLVRHLSDGELADLEHILKHFNKKNCLWSHYAIRDQVLDKVRMQRLARSYPSGRPPLMPRLFPEANDA